MALVIVATAGASTANSYVTPEDAETIAETIMNTTTWDAASDAAKNQALVAATQNIDTMRFRGRKYYWQYDEDEENDSWQALKLPRTLVYDEYPAPSPALTIPAAVQRACVVEAMELLANSGEATATARMIDSGIKSHRIGSFSETFSGSGQQQVVSTQARRLLKKFRKTGVEIQRG